MAKLVELGQKQIDRRTNSKDFSPKQWTEIINKERDEVNSLLLDSRKPLVLLEDADFFQSL